MNKILVCAAAILGSFGAYKFIGSKNSTRAPEYAFDATKSLNLNSKSTSRTKNHVETQSKGVSKKSTTNDNRAKNAFADSQIVSKNVDASSARSVASAEDAATAKTLLESIKTQEQAMQFLKQARLQNPDAIRTAEPMTQMSKQIDQMRGPLEGKLAWDENPDAAVDISMNFNPLEVDGLVRGDLGINLSLNGMSLEDRKFIPILATMAGQGQIPDATVISLSPRRYIQMFQAPGLNQWIGNYYMRNPITGNLSYVGTVRIDIPIK